MNGLSPVDHFLLARNQHNHEQWLEQTMFQTRELQQTLAETAAANQGRKAIIDALLAAYNANDWQALHAILGDYNTRNAIYQSRYFPTLNSMKPA
jgi:hydroxymethylglutaryl-CoA reductase